MMKPLNKEESNKYLLAITEDIESIPVSMLLTMLMALQQTVGMCGVLKENPPSVDFLEARQKCERESELCFNEIMRRWHLRDPG